jgi:hypothetical protein
MTHTAAVFLFLLAYSATSAQTEIEYQTSDGLVRLNSIYAGEDTAVAVPLAGIFGTALMDTALDRGAGFPPDDSTLSLLDIYFLEKSTGEELRFPAKGSQLREYFRVHPDEFRSGIAAERAVALIRQLSASLQVHMLPPVVGGEK